MKNKKIVFVIVIILQIAMIVASAWSLSFIFEEYIYQSFSYHYRLKGKKVPNLSKKKVMDNFEEKLHEWVAKGIEKGALRKSDFSIYLLTKINKLDEIIKYEENIWDKIKEGKVTIEMLPKPSQKCAQLIQGEIDKIKDSSLLLEKKKKLWRYMRRVLVRKNRSEVVMNSISLSTMAQYVKEHIQLLSEQGKKEECIKFVHSVMTFLQLVVKYNHSYESGVHGVYSLVVEENLGNCVDRNSLFALLADSFGINARGICITSQEIDRIYREQGKEPPGVGHIILLYEVQGKYFLSEIRSSTKPITRYEYIVLPVKKRNEKGNEFFVEEEWPVIWLNNPEKTQFISMGSKYNESIVLRNQGLEFEGKGDVDRAEELYACAINTMPTIPRYYVDRGDIYKKQKKWDLAIKDYARAIEWRKYSLTRRTKYEDSAFYEMGYCLCQVKQYDKALLMFERALEVDSMVESSLENCVEICFTQKKYVRTIEYCTKLLKIKKNNGVLHLYRAKSYYAQKKYAKAIEDFMYAKELVDKNCVASYIMAISYKKLGNMPEAKKYLKKAISLDKECWQAYQVLGDLASKNAQFNINAYSEALRMYSKAIEIKASALLYAKRAEIYFKGNDVEVAVKDYRKAIDLDSRMQARCLPKIQICKRMLRDREEVKKEIQLAQVQGTDGDKKYTDTLGVQKREKTREVQEKTKNPQATKRIVKKIVKSIAKEPKVTVKKSTWQKVVDFFTSDMWSAIGSFVKSCFNWSSSIDSGKRSSQENTITFETKTGVDLRNQMPSAQRL